MVPFSAGSQGLPKGETLPLTFEGVAELTGRRCVRFQAEGGPYMKARRHEKTPHVHKSMPVHQKLP